jgi:hypothetical protein
VPWTGPASAHVVGPDELSVHGLPFAGSTVTSAADIAATFAEKTYSHGGFWVGTEADILARLQMARNVGQASLVVGTTLTILDGVTAFSEGDVNGVAGAGTNLAVGGLGLCGPVGLSISLGYFVLDTTVGMSRRST